MAGRSSSPISPRLYRAPCSRRRTAASTVTSGSIPIGLARALYVNLRAGGVVQGGSTITQQAAKNLFLTPERTIKRKIQELMLALWLERRFSKDQILAIYLNRAYFGAGSYGVDAASRKYFGRPATQVNTYQAAMLAGLLKAPSRLNPLVSPEQAESRAQRVLANMVDAGFLDQAHADAAWRQRATSLAQRRVGPNARYFVDWVMAQVPGFVTAPDQDLTIQTTLDARLQRIAEAKVVQFAGGATARKANVGQAALVATTLDGAVRALVGGNRLRGESIQPRDAGLSSAGLGVQTNRLCGGHRGWAIGRQPHGGLAAAGRRVAAEELHQPLPGRCQSSPGHGAVDQHRSGAGGRVRRR